MSRRRVAFAPTPTELAQLLYDMNQAEHVIDKHPECVELKSVVAFVKAHTAKAETNAELCARLHSRLKDAALSAGRDDSE